MKWVRGRLLDVDAGSTSMMDLLADQVAGEVEEARRDRFVKRVVMKHCHGRQIHVNLLEARKYDV